MVTVDTCDIKTGETLLKSDAKTTSGQIQELSQAGAQDVALVHAAENGLVTEGTIDIGGRYMRFYDAKSGADIRSLVNTPKYRDNPERVKVRRLVKLSLSRSGLSTLATMPTRVNARPTS